MVRSGGELDLDWLNLPLPGVSAHSQAMDSLVRAGLAALPFWLILFGIALAAGTDAIRFRTSPLTILWTTLILWDALFSPLTTLSHLDLAPYLALAITNLAKSPCGAAKND